MRLGQPIRAIVILLLFLILIVKLRSQSLQSSIFLNRIALNSIDGATKITPGCDLPFDPQLLSPEAQKTELTKMVNSLNPDAAYLVQFSSPNAPIYPPDVSSMPRQELSAWMWGCQYLQDGRHDTALDIWRTDALKYSGHLADIAIAILHQDHSEKGINYAKLAEQLWAEPTSKKKRLYNQFCTGLRQMQKFTDAVHWCERYAEESNSYAANLLLGRTYLQIGLNDAAFAALQEAQKIDPTRPQVHIYLAEAQRARGEIETARSLLDTALSLDPNNERASIALVEVLAEMGELNMAKNKLHDLLESSPSAAVIKRACNLTVLSDLEYECFDND